MRRIVVGFSGGVTSAWCAGWALRTYPKDEVVLLFHDTMEEHPDTYRFLCQMAAKLDMKITEYSDGRSVTELFRDEGFLGNNQNAMCSRVLKADCKRGPMSIPCPFHQPAAWALYLKNHPTTNRDVDIEIAKMCCSDCSALAPGPAPGNASKGDE